LIKVHRRSGALDTIEKSCCRNGGIIGETLSGIWGTTMLRLAAIFLAFISIAAASAQIQVPADSRLKAITATKTIKIAYRADARPFSFVNDKNEPVGFTIDICRRVVSSIERQFKLDHLKIDWVPVTVQTRFAAVASGKADMECGSSTVTLGRMKEVDFSSFVFVESTGIIVTKASNIRSFSDMAGKKIVVVAGTSNEQAVIAQTKQQKIETTVISVTSGDEAVAMLESGNADGFASDKLLLFGANVKNRAALFMLPDDLSIEPYAITLPRGDWALRLAVNTGLAQTYRSGEIVVLFKAWFDRIGLPLVPVFGIIYGLGSLAD
jgi:glutamate/aspartate transport system substrate-binding protein